MDFKELVEVYRSSLMNRLSLATRYGEERRFEEKVLLHKLEKHRDDPRRQAMYVASFKEGNFKTKDISVITILKRAGIIKAQDRSGKVFIGYPHEDGTYHYL